FDRDGKQDVAVTTGRLNNVSILLNRCRFVTTTSLGSSANPSMFGQPVTLTANVTSGTGGSGIPTGTVTFKDGTMTLASATLSGGTATLATSALFGGSHSITAAYEGDSAFASSSAPITQVVLAQADLSITKTDNQATAVPGTSVSYTMVA